MFLRAKVRKKDGKQHRYFSVVENRRVGRNKTAQRTVLYLGEINDGQEATWRKTLQVFDESQQQHTTLSLFPEDREIPAESSDSIQVISRFTFSPSFASQNSSSCSCRHSSHPSQQLPKARGRRNSISLSLTWILSLASAGISRSAGNKLRVVCRC